MLHKKNIICNSKRGKKNRKKIKKTKEFKTELERKREMDRIKNKLSQFGLSEEFEGIKTFYQEADKFINTGEAWSGKIPIKGCQRVLFIIFTPNKLKESTAALLYDKNV